MFYLDKETMKLRSESYLIEIKDKCNCGDGYQKTPHIITSRKEIHFPKVVVDRLLGPLKINVPPSEEPKIGTLQEDRKKALYKFGLGLLAHRIIVLSMHEIFHINLTSPNKEEKKFFFKYHKPLKNLIEDFIIWILVMEARRNKFVKSISPTDIETSNGELIHFTDSRVVLGEKSFPSLILIETFPEITPLHIKLWYDKDTKKLSRTDFVLEPRNLEDLYPYLPYNKWQLLYTIFFKVFEDFYDARKDFESFTKGDFKEGFSWNRNYEWFLQIADEEAKKRVREMYKKIYDLGLKVKETFNSGPYRTFTFDYNIKELFNLLKV